ncbi:MAG: succinate--CoA ligase subunit alpha [Euryarchaeota archaeon]|nr:succinate--CoA ligase subunit alpha [Euryarchaeota archaeon]
MIYADKDTHIVVLGATGNQGRFHLQRMQQYSKEMNSVGVVAGVTPGKGGLTVEDVPIYNSVREAVCEQDAQVGVMFVPGRIAKDSIMEGADAGLELVVAITEGIPVHDVIKAVAFADANDCTVIGPNCPGLISPGAISLGIIPSHLTKPGKVGIVSRSGTLTYEVVDALTKSNIGQSTIVGIGGDQVIGQTFVDVIDRFCEDKETEAIVLLGEIGGNLEEKGALRAKEKDIPLVAFIAGVSAPPDKRMGHAGAIVSGGEGDALSKIKRLEAQGVPVAREVSDIPQMLREVAGDVIIR